LTLPEGSAGEPPPPVVHDVVVVGGGIGGLAVAHAIVTERPDASVVVLEEAGRVGGQVMTTVSDGYTFEHGASSLMIRPAHAALIDAVGLQDRACVASRDGTRSSVYAGGALHPVPRSPRDMVASGLLSGRGKLRALAEPIMGRAPTADDDTVYDFAARRFGKEFARRVAVTALQGVTAGDAQTTSLRAVSPALYHLDRTAGRLGLLGRAAVAARGRRNEAASPYDGSVTFRDGGLQVLTDTLAQRLAPRIRLGARVDTLQITADRYTAVLCGGDLIHGRRVVLAVPASRAASLLRRLVPDAAAALAEVPYAGMRIVGLGYGREAFARPVQGLGFLAPPRDPAGVIGAILASNMFPEQAPDDHVLVRVFAGGVWTPAAVDEPQEVAVDRARRALQVVYGVRGEPVFIRTAHHPRVMPQYGPQHARRVERLLHALRAYPGLVLAPTTYTGVGLHDTISGALTAARAV
jgi:oxygen-dependent protoporphyrinogen oxidase